MVRLNSSHSINLAATASEHVAAVCLQRYHEGFAFGWGVLSQATDAQTPCSRKFVVVLLSSILLLLFYCQACVGT